MRIFLTVLGVILFALSSAAWAQDLVIVNSTAPSLKPGQMVESDSPIEVPAGASVTLVSESGKILTLKGPRSGPPGMGGGGGGDANLLSSLSGLLSASGKETASLGTMRAVAPPMPPDDPWVINIGRSGDHCVPKGGPVTLWRAKSAKAVSLSLKSLTDRSKSKAAWPAGASSLQWPAGMTIADGAKYLARLKGSRTASKLVLHLVPGDLPSDAHRAAWMAGKGCVKQARRLLARMR